MRRMWVWIACLVVATQLLTGHAWGAVTVRLPIAMNRWYPANPSELRADVEKRLEAARAVNGAPQGDCVALIVPTSSYSACGDIMARGFAQLKPNAYDRVIVLAPAHFADFTGASTPSVMAYATPLGEVPIDGPALGRLTIEPLISLRSLRYNASERTPVHENEYAVEVLLPFLQVQLQKFRLVPIVTGEIRGRETRYDDEALEALSRAVKKIMTPRTLLVVGSGLTHYGPTHGFTPDTENRAEKIKELDVEALTQITRLDLEGFRRFLNDTGTPVDGDVPLQILMRVLPRPIECVMLGYSSTILQSPEAENSISFAAIGFFRPAGEMAEDVEYRTTPDTDESVDSQAAIDGGEPAVLQDDAADPEGAAQE